MIIIIITKIIIIIIIYNFIDVIVIGYVWFQFLAAVEC